jgi:hypothetical protein
MSRWSTIWDVKQIAGSTAAAGAATVARAAARTAVR